METRSHPRVAVSHPVFYSSDILPTPKFASTLELSMGGARIETLHGFQKDESLKISIAIGSKLIRCTGHVVDTVWTDGDRSKATVQFEEISKEDTLYLGEYISSVMGQKCEKKEGSLRGSTNIACQGILLILKQFKKALLKMLLGRSLSSLD